MRLKDLLKEIDVLEILGTPEAEIRGIEDDSRGVSPGALFVARRGVRVDGHRYIREAVSRGAVAVVREDPPEPGLPVVQIRVPDSAEALGRLMGAFYGHPQRDLFLVGITGTNGKSSVAWMLREALQRLGQPAGLIGTLLYDTLRRREKARETTPGPKLLYPLLTEMRAAGARAAVLEVSSHALAQKRVAGLSFSVGVFTNLSRDHLDYHHDLEEYFAAKRLLFERHLAEDGVAVVNGRDPRGRRLVEDLSGRVRVVQLFRNPTVEIVERSFRGLRVRVREGAVVLEIGTRLFGDFQAENLLAVWAVLRVMGWGPEEVARALEGIEAPPGRLEPVASFNGGRVFVDYAHTPEALEVALSSLRKITPGRLLCLFGCGGNRDRGKRPQMGRVAARLSDRVFVTSDNPREEDPGDIIREILSGMNGGAPREVEPDRRMALRRALLALGPGDVLLVAGKGHEDYQEIAGRRIPFSDREEVKRLVQELS